MSDGAYRAFIGLSRETVVVIVRVKSVYAIITMPQILARMGYTLS